MRLKEQVENLQLIYLAIAFLWGVCAVIFQGWRVEISSLWVFVLAWRGFGIEKEMNPTVPDQDTQDRQLSPRHGEYYRHEIGYVFLVVMLITALQFVWILKGHF